MSHIFMNYQLKFSLLVLFLWFLITFSALIEFIFFGLTLFLWLPITFSALIELIFFVLVLFPVVFFFWHKYQIVSFLSFILNKNVPILPYLLHLSISNSFPEFLNIFTLSSCFHFRIFISLCLISQLPFYKIVSVWQVCLCCFPQNAHF